MRPVCYVFGAGTRPGHPPRIKAGDMVIAADGGYLYTLEAGIHADVLIGDFDSLDGICELEAAAPVVLRLPKEKDQTDTFAALAYGLERGFKAFHVYGGTGGRLDHTLANIQCLAYLLGNGARGYLHDGSAVVTAARTEINLAPRDDGIISVFALGGALEGVYLRGLKYGLENATLTTDFPLGVSNEFIGRPVSIGAERGDMLVVYPEGTIERRRGD